MLLNKQLSWFKMDCNAVEIALVFVLEAAATILNLICQ